MVVVVADNPLRGKVYSIDLVTCGSAYVVVLVTGNKCVIIRLVTC